MIKLAYIYRLLLLTGLFLTIIEMSEILSINHASNKTEINAVNRNLLKTTPNENLIADVVENEITEDDFFPQYANFLLKSESNHFSFELHQEDTTDLTKIQIRFYKLPHLFILFHCWKYLCL